MRRGTQCTFHVVETRVGLEDRFDNEAERLKVEAGVGRAVS